ncbi:MAG: 4-alpha-glucanotransferase, partial [Sideroxyarcus sp.]|nr:4-alpha-glucanotransferase [Sideroxyarcus sp.]
RERFKALPLIVEDLGAMTREVEKLRDQFMLPGLRVLEFGLESMDDKSYHMPGQYPERAIAYTGTHDNNTFRGWFQTRTLYGKTAREVARIHSFALRHLQADKKSVTSHAVSAVLRSKANLAIIPMQDLLDLPGTARLNTPGTRKHNWEWRLTGHELTDALKEHLHAETKKAKR